MPREVSMGASGLQLSYLVKVKKKKLFYFHAVFSIDNVQVQAVENQPDFIQLQENTVVQKGETFVKKEFPGHGCFFGVVTDIYVGKDGKLLYDILYEDNDSEHLDIFELAPIIVKNAGTTAQQYKQIIVQPPLNTHAESVSSPTQILRTHTLIELPPTL